jgi:hypothetical protein
MVVDSLLRTLHCGLRGWYACIAAESTAMNPCLKGAHICLMQAIASGESYAKERAVKTNPYAHMHM